MVKPLGQLLWFASIVGLLFGSASALCEDAAQETEPSLLLTQTALTEPDTIANWLEQHADTADRETAEFYFDLGTKAQEQENWSRATKAFGESALFFPTPTALRNYGDNALRQLARVRTHTNDSSQTRADLSRTLAIYRSALAAEEHLKMLPASILSQLKADEECLSTYLAQGDTAKAETTAPMQLTPSAQMECRPLELYQTGK